MAKLIFNKETGRGTGWNREPRADEFAIEPARSNFCPTFPSEYRRFQYVNNVLSEYPGWEAEVAEQEHQQQERAIRARYSAMLVDIAKPYGPEERETWKTQEEEARSWMVDNDAPCTMIRAMATARDIAINILVAKIIANADKFRSASGQILGAQQAEIDLLYPELKDVV